MSKIKITQVRSNIRRPGDQKRTLIALGLKKMNHSVEVEATSQILGMVKKIDHLLNVEKL
jgi:large subunit ribosomal protein L30